MSRLSQSEGVQIVNINNMCVERLREGDSVFCGDFACLIPLKYELDALKRVISALETSEESEPYAGFRDDLGIISGLHDCLEGERETFFENLR